MQIRLKKQSTKELIRKNTKSHLTDRKKRLISGGVIAIILAITPFLFYLYKYAPADSKIWETSIFTINSKGFGSAQGYVHALFTKITFVLITGLWFITSKHWWRWAILVPFMMFLFQLLGVVNYNVKFIDEFNFWLSLPIVIPTVLTTIWIGQEINKTIGDLDLREELEEELEEYDYR